MSKNSKRSRAPSASVLEDKETVLSEIEALVQNAYSKDETKFKSARIIQRYFRGYVVREHIQILNRNATTIQRYFKGFKTRMELYNSLTSKVGDFEDRMATILQKTWRGFMSRKFKFNYEGLQCWLEQVKHENCHVQHKLYEFKVESEENYARCKQDHWDYVRSRLHHLLRTQNIPGVFSCIHSNELSQLEKCLKNVKYFPKARLSEMNSANQQLEKKRKKLLLQNKLNKTNLRKTWRSLNTMPPVLDDSYPKCLEYHHSKKDCMNFPKSNNSKRKVETTSCNGLSAGSDLNDRLWRERIMMLEKARTPCMLSPKQFLTSYRPNTQSRFATHNKVNRN